MKRLIDSSEICGRSGSGMLDCGCYYLSTFRLFISGAFTTGGYMEMSSILADQYRPISTNIVYEHKCGGRVVAGSQPMSTAVRIT